MKFVSALPLSKHNALTLRGNRGNARGNGKTTIYRYNIHICYLCYPKKERCSHKGGSYKGVCPFRGNRGNKIKNQVAEPEKSVTSGVTPLPLRGVLLPHINDSVTGLKHIPLRNHAKSKVTFFVSEVTFNKSVTESGMYMVKNTEGIL